MNKKKYSRNLGKSSHFEENILEFEKMYKNISYVPKF